jgi:hypothetical protein
MQSQPLRDLTIEGGGLSAPRPGRFTPGKDPVPVVQEAVWVAGPVWAGAKNLAPTGNIFNVHIYSTKAIHSLSVSLI